MAETTTEKQAWRVVDRIRLRLNRLLYDAFFVAMVRDESWQEPLITSLAPAPNNWILDFGPGSASTAVALARRYPEARFVAVESNRKAVEKARRYIERNAIGSNLTVIELPLHARLPFDAGSFDKALCVLTFYDRLPNEKLVIAKEIFRVLRHGGTLYVADYDQPEVPSERGILQFTRYLSGPEAAEAHINGSWTRYIAKAGFSGIRRQSSYPIGIGRISMIKARKR